MDIASASMALSQVDCCTKVGTAMLDKTLETNEQLGDSLVQMIDSAQMELSVNPYIGSNFDVRI